MRIAVRNLAGASYAGNRFASSDAQHAAWESVATTGADVLLVQEARTSDGVGFVPDAFVATSFVDPTSLWGSVVATSGLDMDLTWRPEHPVLEAFGNYIASGRVRVDGREISLVSVHSPWQWHQWHWEALGGAGECPSGKARPWPSDVLLDGLAEALHGFDAVVAGDWNEAPNYPHDEDPGTVAWFDRARSAGWTEVVADAFLGSVRTNFTPQAQTSYQNDHVFVSNSLASKVSRVAVWNEPARRVSDHAGIVMDLAL